MLLMIILSEAQLDVWISLSLHVAQQYNGFLHVRDWLHIWGTSLSVAQMKLMLDDGCPAPLMPVTRGQVPIVMCIIKPSGAFKTEALDESCTGLVKRDH